MQWRAGKHVWVPMRSAPWVEPLHVSAPVQRANPYRGWAAKLKEWGASWWQQDWAPEWGATTYFQLSTASWECENKSAASFKFQKKLKIWIFMGKFLTFTATNCKQCIVKVSITRHGACQTSMLPRWKQPTGSQFVTSGTLRCLFQDPVDDLGSNWGRNTPK